MCIIKVPKNQHRGVLGLTDHPAQRYTKCQNLDSIPHDQILHTLFGKPNGKNVPNLTPTSLLSRSPAGCHPCLYLSFKGWNFFFSSRWLEESWEGNTVFLGFFKKKQHYYLVEKLMVTSLNRPVQFTKIKAANPYKRITGARGCLACIGRKKNST